MAEQAQVLADDFAGRKSRRASKPAGLQLFDLTRAGPVVVWFVLLATPVLVTLALLLAPFQGLDEAAQFYRTVQVSEGHLLPVKSADGAAAGDFLDTNVHMLGEYYYFMQISRWKNAFGEAPTDRGAAWAIRPSGRREFTAFSNTVIYFPLAYVAPATAVAVMRAAGAPPLAWLYGARLTNVVLAIALSVFALTLFPEARLFVLLAILLPRSLLGIAGLSADSLLIPFAALFAAGVARIAVDRRPSSLVYGLLIAATVFICVGKIAYIPLVFIPPVVALIRDRRPSAPVTILSVAGLATLAIWLAWTKVISRDVLPIRHDEHIDIYLQLLHVLRSPMHAASVLAQTLEANGFGYFDTMIGGELNAHATRIPYLFVGASALLMLITAFVGQESIGFRPLPFALVLAIEAGVALAIFLLLYMQYTGVDLPQVEGVQGRYFLPLLPLLIVFLPKASLPLRGAVVLSAAVFGWTLLTSAETLHVMKLRYMDSRPVAGLRFADPHNRKAE